MPQTPLEKFLLAAQESKKEFTIDRRTLVVGTDRTENNGKENSPLKEGVRSLVGTSEHDIRMPMSYSYHRVLKGETENAYDPAANIQWLVSAIKKPEIADRPTACHVFHSKLVKALRTSLVKDSDANKVDISRFMSNYKKLTGGHTGASYEEVLALLHCGYSVIKSVDTVRGVAILESPEVLAAVSPSGASSSAAAAAAGGEVAASAAARPV